MRKNCVIMAMLYAHSIGNQLQNTMVVLKMRMRDTHSVPSVRYSSVCIACMENFAHPYIKNYHDLAFFLQ